MRIHIVQKGDTLWTIAKKYGVNFEELKKMNAQLSNPEMIMPGMKIKVPGSGTVKHEHHHHEHHHQHHKPHGDHKQHHKEQPIVQQHQHYQHHQPHVHKEMPKAQHPIVQHKEVPKAVVIPPKEVKKEMPKEKPQFIYQPVMPAMPTLPEVDINNYYMMNMSQTQAQIQQQPQPQPVIEEKKEMPVPPTVMPVMPIQEPPCPQPVYFNPCFNPCYPVMPICDPCYPYPAFPQMHPQQWAQPAPMPAMPMPAPYQGMGSAYPGTMWDDESSGSPQMGMNVAPQYGQFTPSSAVEGAASMPQMPFQPYQDVMPGFQAPYQPHVGHQMPGSADCGCGGSTIGSYAMPQQQFMLQQQFMPQQFMPMPQAPFPYGPGMPEGAGTYAIPTRYDIEEEDE